MPFSTPVYWWAGVVLLTNPTGLRCPRFAVVLASDWAVGPCSKAPGILVPRGFVGAHDPRTQI